MGQKTMTNQKELEKLLNTLLTGMEGKGMIQGLENRDALVQAVVMTISNVRGDLTREDLRDPTFQKALCLSLMFVHLGSTKGMEHLDLLKKDPDGNISLIANLFKKNANLDITRDELKNVLKQLLKHMDQYPHPTYAPAKKLTEEEIEALAERMARNIDAFKLLPADMEALHQDPSVIDTVAEIFSASLRNLYGGVDPRFPGSLVSPVVSIIGNLYGIVDPIADNAESLAFIDISNRPDPGPLGDPSGAQNEIRIRLACEGLDVLLMSLENEILHVFFPSPQNKPHNQA